MSERFKVDLRGVIDLAANHLYTTPEVFVRELVQNAVDAITARARVEPGHAGAVRLELTPGSGGGPSTIAVTDNGVGLTLPEVHEFLSTVGGSSKREDAEAAAERIEEEGGYLGRFGIGLLSCFMVTDEIVVVTRSAREAGSPAVEWRGRADGSYAVRELAGTRVPAGTSVYLTCKQGAEEYYERDRLVDLARRYAEMLPTPIVVSCGEDDARINRATPPWSLDAGDWAALEEACREGLGFEPLDAFPVSAPAGGVRGYLFIRPGAAGRWDGRHKLYARGMFVSDHVHGLLPPWATFVGACLNSSGLRLTASRESLHQGEALAATSEELGAAVRARLVHLMRSDPARFAAVMAVHDTEIRGLAVKDPDFFSVIIDLLEFETTLGPVRFGEFRRDNETVLVARTAEQYRRLATIAEPLGIRVFNGGYTYHEELLTRAAQRWPELTVRGYDTSDLADELPEPGDPGRFEGLADAGAEALGPHGCGVVVRDFAPESSPAFFALGLDAEYHRQLDRTKAMSSELWTAVLDAMAPRPEVVSPTRLCLNARSPLIRRLAGTADPGLQRTAVEILYVQALMAGQHALTGGELDLLHRGMERLLDRAVTPKETR